MDRLRISGPGLAKLDAYGMPIETLGLSGPGAGGMPSTGLPGPGGGGLGPLGDLGLLSGPGGLGQMGGSLFGMSLGSPSTIGRVSGAPDWLNTPLTWPGREAKKAAATTGTTPGATTSSPTGDIWGVIDEEARDDPQLAQALKLAVQLESGGRADAVGDQGQSHGYYQIHQPAHGQRITPEQSRDARQATRYRLPEFRAAKARVTQEQPGLWEANPMEAAARTAFLAQRPASMYGAANVQNAWQAIQHRQAAPAPATPQAAQGVQAAAIAEAQRHVGKPYLLAAHANNPAANAFDCSGLVQWSYKTAGVALPRTAQEQFNATQRVAPNDVRAGDLIFFHSTYNAGTPVTHVGIALGNGQMLQAGSGGVGTVDLNTPYWRSKLYGFGRVT